eukprot:COSAG06_NODE_36246_length_449_cov_2.357143_1_plen_69_part_10
MRAPLNARAEAEPSAQPTSKGKSLRRASHTAQYVYGIQKAGRAPGQSKQQGAKCTKKKAIGGDESHAGM